MWKGLGMSMSTLYPPMPSAPFQRLYTAFSHGAEQFGSPKAAQEFGCGVSAGSQMVFGGHVAAKVSTQGSLPHMGVAAGSVGRLVMAATMNEHIQRAVKFRIVDRVMVPPSAREASSSSESGSGAPEVEITACMQVPVFARVRIPQRLVAEASMRAEIAASAEANETGQVSMATMDELVESAEAKLKRDGVEQAVGAGKREREMALREEGRQAIRFAKQHAEMKQSRSSMD